MKITSPNITIQGSPEWHEFRKKHIGASEIACVMNKSPYKSRYQLWLEKAGRAEPPPKSKTMLKGNLNECAILDEFFHRTGEFMLGGVFVYDLYPILSASLDGLSSNKKSLVEVKYCNKSVLEAAQQGEVVEHYMLQIQQQLLVSGAELGFFFCWHEFSNQYALVEVFPDKDIQDEIIREAKIFWELVKEDKEPERGMQDLAHKKLVHEKEWYEASKDLKRAHAREKAAREMLILEAENPCIGSFAKIIQKTRTSFDYKKACEENSIDLDNYKKKTITFWEIKTLDKTM